MPEGYALWTAARGAGETILAGLPDIFGYFSTNGYSGFDAFYQAGGCFWLDLEQKNNYQADTYERNETTKAQAVGFSAHRYNTIYGNSNTVQPPAYKVYAWKRIA